MPKPRIDRSGKRYGKLVGIKPVKFCLSGFNETKRKTVLAWQFQCDCGRKKVMEPEHAKKQGNCGYGCKLKTKE